jgi:hypothetical protein
VKWTANRKASAGVKASARDGLDDGIWEVVRESTEAAHRGDANGHVAPLLRFERETPHDTKVGIYLWYLLRYRVAALLGRRPNREDLQALASQYYSQFSKLIRGDQSQLEDTLLTVFALAPEDRKVKGGNAVVMGSAALGVLLDNPAADLEGMRPHLAAWWQRNKAGFGGAGAGS